VAAGLAFFAGMAPEDRQAVRRLLRFPGRKALKKMASDKRG
jgi:hypothetical protein